MLGFVLLTGALSACSSAETDDPTASPVEREESTEVDTVAATPTATMTPAPTNTPGPTNTPRPTPTPQNSRGYPAPLNTALQVGDWVIIVHSVTPDATAAVMAENQFNDPPAPGRQFFVATISASYIGADSSSLLFDLDFSALGPSSVQYQDFTDTCGVIPDELDSFVEVFEGGIITGNMCWSIAASDAADLVMFVEESFAFDDDTRVWFSLH